MVQSSAFAAGINLFDTAEGYGSLDLPRNVGTLALEELACRDEGDSCHQGRLRSSERAERGAHVQPHSATNSRRCELSLKRLRSDRIDLISRHWPDPLHAHRGNYECHQTALVTQEAKSDGAGVRTFSQRLCWVLPPTLVKLAAEPAIPQA